MEEEILTDFFDWKGNHTSYQAVRSLRKYRAIKVVSWRVNFSTDAIADFEGLLGSSARKTVLWTVFSENGSADPRR